MLGLAAAVMLQAAGAAGEGPKPSVVSNPDWLRRPSGEDLARVYPQSAANRGVGGRATIQCLVNKDGSLSPCEILSEDPPGEGFGQAALDLGPAFKLRPMTKDGQPVDGGTVRIPLRFLVPGGSMDSFSAFAGCYGETSARAQREPKNAELLSAYGFYAAQFALIAASQNTPPSLFERTLATAREAATKPGDDYSPSLSACMKVFRERRSPAAR